MISQSLEIFRNPSVETFKKHLASATVWKALVYIALADLVLLTLIYLTPYISKNTQILITLVLPLLTLLSVAIPTYITHKAVLTATGKSNFSKLFYGYSLTYVPPFTIGLMIGVMFQWVPNQSPMYLKVMAIILFISGFIGALYLQKNWKVAGENLIQSIFNANVQELLKIQDKKNSLYKLVKIVTIGFLILMISIVWLQFFTNLV